jgi:integrase
MSEVNSTARVAPSKPAKPYPAYPLTPHPSGRWCKKIRGKLHYFGPWDDSTDRGAGAALDKYLAQKDALHAGRKPRAATDGATVRDAVNSFLEAKTAMVDTGELSPRTWTDYEDACKAACKVLSKTRLVCDLDHDDFTKLRTKLAKKCGPHRLGKTIQCIRSLFKHAYEAGLIDRPVRYGPGFKRPSKKTLRLHRAAQGPRLFTADEIHKLLHGAGLAMRAMILLGVNAGMGNSDVGNLPLSAINLDTGWLDFPRPKTGVGRRCWLWPETVKAIREALAKRPAPKDKTDAALVFVTKYGESWAKDKADSPITKEMRKLMNGAKINGHRNFYVLRHTFRTIADAAKDQPATDHIMGHESEHMSSHYRERIDDGRLRAVAQHVRAWLFGTAAKEGGAQ